MRTKIESIFTVVPGAERVSFLPHYFGSKFFMLDGYLLFFADKQISSYERGAWEFAVTRDGVPFMYPLMREDSVSISNLLGDVIEELPVFLAGFIVTLQALKKHLMDMQLLDRSSGASNHLVGLYHTIKDTGHMISKELGCGQAYSNLAG